MPFAFAPRAATGTSRGPRANEKCPAGHSHGRSHDTTRPPPRSPVSAPAPTLGSEEFVDRTIHRIGDTPRRRSEHAAKPDRRFDAPALISAVGGVFGLSREEFCGPEKNAKAILGKKVLILIGREQGAGINGLALVAGLDTSNISRRHDAARAKLATDRKLAYAKARAEQRYVAHIAESQT